MTEIFVNSNGSVYVSHDHQMTWELVSHSPIPEGSMRVGPGTDAVVWRVCPDWNVEL